MKRLILRRWQKPFCQTTNKLQRSKDYNNRIFKENRRQKLHTQQAQTVGEDTIEEGPHVARVDILHDGTTSSNHEQTIQK